MRIIALILLILQSAFAQQKRQSSCTALVRDLRDCPAQLWSEEYSCLERQNSMTHFMSCVISRSETHGQRLCRAEYETSDPDDDDYDAWQYTSASSSDGRQICMTPRNVLLHASDNRCRHCELTGALQACPENDPDFINCLCEQRATPKNFCCFAECFMPSSQDSVSVLEGLCAGPFYEEDLCPRSGSHIGRSGGDIAHIAGMDWNTSFGPGDQHELDARQRVSSQQGACTLP